MSLPKFATCVSQISCYCEDIGLTSALARAINHKAECLDYESIGSYILKIL